MDAPPRIETSGRWKRGGRAGVQARGAGSEMARRVRRVGRQSEIDEQGAEEEIAAESLVQQHRVLADPAEPRAPGEVALQQRGRVHDAAALAAGTLRLQPRQ